MRRYREIIVLLALMLGLMGYVLWYVIDRRARQRTTPPPVATKTVEPATAPPTAPVDLTKHDRQTIDFSSGKPVVKDSPEDRAALEKAAKEIAEATAEVTFEAAKKKAEPTSAPPAKK